MESKQPLREELPPPYSVRASDYVSPSHNPQETSMTSHLQHHLAFLPSRIRMTREARSIQQSLDDASLLDFIIPEVEAFLSCLSSLHPTPKQAYLKLVPEAAVPRNAKLSGMDDMRQRGEHCQVVRVTTSPAADEKKSPPADSPGATSQQDWSTGREFSDWGRFGDSLSTEPSSQARDVLWWKDEAMARRLASHLQPATVGSEPPALETPVQAAVEHRLPAQKEKKKWPWARKSSASDSTASFAARSVERDVETFPGRSNAAASKAPPKEHGGARMSITAEEVAFRVENDFGIMESAGGWAVVLAVWVTA
ncbi:hypothetical protein F4861DRAFT_18938 [Xylaria intraflava]|nr:hypothetical protein F4861DRAFT_18938 [Xylaria intraflava]